MSQVDILEEALKLRPEERLVVVEGLLRSLDAPNAELDRIWAEESMRRLSAYRAGRLTSLSMEEIFGVE